MPDFVTSTPFLVVTGVVILILLIAFVSSRYHVAGANEALIVAGSRGAKVRDERGQANADTESVDSQQSAHAEHGDEAEKHRGRRYATQVETEVDGV